MAVKISYIVPTHLESMQLFKRAPVNQDDGSMDPDLVHGMLLICSEYP